MSWSDAAGAAGTRCVVFLQNPWSPMYAGDEWPRESWLRALHACKTGKQLSILFPLPAAPGIHYDNTTRQVAAGPSGVCPPDPSHIGAVLAEHQPRFVLACGKQAGDCVPALWPGRLILMPHPAWRLMPKNLLLAVRDLIESDRFERVKVSCPAYGQIVIEEIARDPGKVG